MQPFAFTEYEVKELIRARKFIHRVREDNYRAARNNTAVNEIRIRYEIRRADKPHQHIKLQYFARLERPAFSGEAPKLPGISLNWYGERLRGACQRL